jgi:hypothetical protein
VLTGGETYTFHIDTQGGPSTFVGEFIRYADDNQGRPTMFTLLREGQDSGEPVLTDFLAEKIISIDHGDTYHLPPLTG